jgi:hypothetical protein
MLQLRCTKKVLDQFGISPKSLVEPEASDAPLGNWCVNMVTIERRKTLIFMSERTLLSFLIFGVRKGNSTDLGELFVRGLFQLLELEGFAEAQIEGALGKDRLLTLSKSHNRKALGNLNDLQQKYQHHVAYDGGFQHCDLWQIISSTNRMPQKNLGWKYSIEVARELMVQS